MKRIMNFQAFLLNEAQSFAPEELKTKIKKDPRIADILKKGVKFEDLKDPKTFFETMKNVFLNNPQVIKYQKDTDAFSDWGWDFKALRKVKPEEFNKDHFENLTSELQSFLKAVGKKEKLMVSTDLKKDIEEWINTSGRHNHMFSKSAQAEFNSIPGLKPDKPIKLYRGLLWNKRHMSKDGDGRKFVNAIRKGTDIVDYVAENPESWTSDKHVADKFATAGPATSQFSAMLNWMSKGDSKIEGDLGAIVAILAKPEDILVDLSKVGNKLNTVYEWEDEVVLKPGKYVAKIITLYNKKGEIKPQEFLASLEASKDSEVSKVAGEFKKEFLPKVTNFFNDYYKGNVIRYWNPAESFNPQAVERILKRKEKIMSLIDEYIDWTKKLKFDQKAPELNAATSDDEKYVYDLFGGFYRLGGKGGKMLYQTGSAEEALKLLTPSDRELMKEFGDYLKKSGAIKRDISFYKPETIRPQIEAHMQKLVNAAHAEVAEDQSEIEKEGYAIAKEVWPLISLINILERVYNSSKDV